MAETYHAHFTSGALLEAETARVLERLQEGEAGQKAISEGDLSWLNINSRKARITTAREINRRLNAVADKSMWEFFLISPEADRKIMLYYACCKAYPLLLDFHLEVAMDKWRSFNLDLGRKDFLNFLDRKSIHHPEIEAWSEATRNKLAQVALRIMAQAGLLRAGSIHKVPASDALWRRFVEIGESWFLELMFLNAEERDAFI